ncbi:PREDICTED: uncharacterized protein LOC108362611 isoform X2 [Rhagoletis zephyria]|uniref:uncharacterized protein LOC108362611 isoform X2 n=1 Tax=Rhagoletis zephyria TaxID=28612 RepID=UPI000811762B|nr:PREDICTED: uncharacterized protein LOC108362611 isoform X2 [Rhagoletis zephyria]
MIESGVDNTEALDCILQAANKHPNSRVSKLIHSVEEERSQKNIVLLLIELAEHVEYATDFSISLKYYLDLFEKLGIGREIVLNEAGLLLLNSSKVYARRVDFIQELVERQILTLSNADKEIVQSRAENQTKNSTEKPKRTRKRLVAVVDDPYEVELVPRKFRKLSEEKRFLGSHPPVNPRVTSSRSYRIDSEQYIHPAAWQHSSIVDLENEEDIDCKRNYKLFTYHVEHRYNTLVADINFRLHFKVKDYIDEEEERLAEVEERDNLSISDLRDWPPLSEEYVEKYLNLENRVLAIGEALKQCKRPRLEKEPDVINNKVTTLEKVQHSEHNIECDHSLTRSKEESAADSMQHESGLSNSIALKNSSSVDIITNFNESALLENSEKEITITSDEYINVTNLTAQSACLGRDLNSTEKSILECINESENLENASAFSFQMKSFESNALGNSATLNEINKSEIAISNIAEQSRNDTGLGDSIKEQTQMNDCSNINIEKKGLLVDNPDLTDNSSVLLNKDKCDQQIIEVTAEMKTNDDDEGVYFSDLDDQEQRMLSPRVVTTDVFPCIPNKENITIIVDDDIRTLLNIVDDEPPPTYTMPVQIRPFIPPVKLNIFKFHEKILRRRLLFKLGSEMELFLQSRSMKRIHCTDANEQRQYRPMKLFNDSLDAANEAKEINRYDSETDYILSDGEDTEDFLGFTEEEQANKISHRLSRDSGVDADVPLTSNLSKDTKFQPEYAEKYNENTQNPRDPKDSEIEERNNSEMTKSTNTIELTNEVHSEMSNSIENSSLFIEDVHEIENSKTKIQKWHEYLHPILAKARERHHFDVFQLGTEIMNELQKPIISRSHTQTSSITFQEVMINKDESYVSRYFLSTLLLANQNNIKIGINNRCTEKPSTWSDINLELLDTKRHTVALEDNIGIIHSKVRDKNKSVHGRLKKCPTIPEVASIAVMDVSNEVVHVNLNIVRPLKQIEKLPSTNDDYDSGIFSTEECAS